MRLPDAILNAPELLPGLDLYMAAFVALSTCRPVGMSEGPIPWTAVKTYADHEGFYGAEFDRLATLVTALDVEYLKYRRRQAEKK